MNNLEKGGEAGAHGVVKRMYDKNNKRRYTAVAHQVPRINGGVKKNSAPCSGVKPGHKEGTGKRVKTY